MIRVLIIAVIVLLEVNSFAVGNCDGAGNCYVSIIATGTGTGADWTNACTDFTGACDVTNAAIRGTTIWVGGSPGTGALVGPAYTVQNFSAPASGTTPVTIMFATVINHGTDTGWIRSSALAPAQFTGPINITTDYWVINGQFRATGGATFHDVGQAPFYFGYYIRVNNTNLTGAAINISGSHVSLSYMQIQGSSCGYGNNCAGTDVGINYAPGVTNENVDHSWFYATGGDSVNITLGSTFTFEYNLFSFNRAGLQNVPSQAINVGDVSYLVVRYNKFLNITGNAILTDGNTDATAFTPNWYIYGNEIFWATNSRNAITLTEGLNSGIVNLTGETLNGGVIQVYNNTIAAVNRPLCATTITCNTTALNLNGSPTGSCAAHSQNCGTTAGTVYNNLWYNPYQAQNFTRVANAQWTPTGDYGEGICDTTGCPNGGSFTTTGANDVTADTGNPFVSFSGQIVWGLIFNVFNFRLKSHTAPGLTIPNWTTTPSGCAVATPTTIPNCENVDPITEPPANRNQGNPNNSGVDTPRSGSIDRGNNTSVDRGAYQVANRALLTVTLPNYGLGLHMGQSATLLPICTWNAPPGTQPAGTTGQYQDNCPNGNQPFVQRWDSMDKTLVTVTPTATGATVTALNNPLGHNAIVWLRYGGILQGNQTIQVTVGDGSEPIAALPCATNGTTNCIVRTGSPLAMSGFDTTAFDAAFPTTYSLPAGCPPTCNTPYRYVHAPDVTTLRSAVANSQPGDVITLDAGTTYSLNTLILPAHSATKPNPWTYIVSSNMSSLPPPGTRVSPNDAPNMPHIVGTDGSSMFVMDAGADHWWIAGIHYDCQSTVGGNATAISPGNPVCYAVTNSKGLQWPASTMPDSFTIDRCYAHGDATHDLAHGVMLNVSRGALIDSYIGPAANQTQDGQAMTAYATPGPLKIINNFLWGYGENQMLGGAGGQANMYTISDVYFQHNTFWNDPADRVIGITIPPHQKWALKNVYEYKNCTRCLTDGNIMQGMWSAGQSGAAIALGNSGTGVNGPYAANNDITFVNNIVTNAIAGWATSQLAGANYACDPLSQACFYPGENRRANVMNNLYIMGYQGPPGGRAVAGAASWAVSVPRIDSDKTYRHNTFVGRSLTALPSCDGSIFINTTPTAIPRTNNLWFLDNVMCRQVLGYSSLTGTNMLNEQIGDPSNPPVTTRFYGNVMQYFPGGTTNDAGYTWPPNNQAVSYATNPFTYAHSAIWDYTLTSTTQIGSDGLQSGIDYAVLMQHQRQQLGPYTISGTLTGCSVLGAGWPLNTGCEGITVSISGADTLTVETDASGNYSFPGLAAGSYTITPYFPPYTFSPASTPVAITTASATGINFTATQTAFMITGTLQASTGCARPPCTITGATVTLVPASGTNIITHSTVFGYSLGPVPAGSYTVVPSLSGYIFSPVTQQLNVTADTVQPFTAVQGASRPRRASGVGPF